MGFYRENRENIGKHREKRREKVSERNSSQAKGVFV
jgi:hypothetical protein